MIRNLLLASAAVAMATIAQPAFAAAAKPSAATSATLAASNPFARPSTLPFQTPDFSKIKDSDYLPAILAGMAQQKREVLAIANNPAGPTFANTVVAMERSGQLLERAGLAFNAVNGANTNDTLQAVDTKTAPLFAAHSDFIYLNQKLFQRFKTLHDNQASLNLNPEQAKLMDVYYKQFVHAGAQLPPDKQSELKTINKRLSTLQTEFTQKLLAASKSSALHVTDRAALAGLSDEQINAAAEAAKARKLDGYVVSLQNTTQQPLLDSLTNHETRQALMNASLNRAEHGDANDTRTIIQELAKLRAEKAALFGAANWADYTLYDQMAKDRATAVGFLDRLAPAVAAKEEREWADIVSLAKSQGAGFQPTAADWNFYAEQIRKQRYAIDSDQLKQYFEFNKVLEDGVFYAANQLYGLTFKERKDIPTWSPDMRVFQVYDADGKELAIFMIDPWKRDNKNGGAWMSNLVNQSYLRGTKPVVFNVQNFTKPAPGQPMLISWDDVTTLFHEFGHALHGMFASQPIRPCRARTLRVTSWSSRHSSTRTGRSIRKSFRTMRCTTRLVSRSRRTSFRKSSRRGLQPGLRARRGARGREARPRLALTAGGCPTAGCRQVRNRCAGKSGQTADLPPRYRTNYFLHIWSNGYSAGYYAYPWTKMLAQDSFAWFQQHGGLTRANGQRFRDMILSRGNTLNYAEMYRAWAGHDPQIQPYLDFYGLGGGDAAPAPAGTVPPPPPVPVAPANSPKPGERGR